MTLLEARLIATLPANAGLREKGERLVAAYVTPASDRPAIIDELIRLFDGPMVFSLASCRARLETARGRGHNNRDFRTWSLDASTFFFETNLTDAKKCEY
jgi:hypothetical protein